MKELLEIRKDIGDVISMSTAAYDGRWVHNFVCQWWFMYVFMDCSPM